MMTPLVMGKTSTDLHLTIEEEVDGATLVSPYVRTHMVLTKNRVHYVDDKTHSHFI